MYKIFMFAWLTGCLLFRADAAVVNASSDDVRWRAITNTVMTFSWDWSWEWVPADAVSVRLSVIGARGKIAHDAVYAKPGVSAAVDFGAVIAANEDIYTSTLSFRDVSGNVVASKTAKLDTLYGYFGEALVRGGELDSAQWMKALDQRAVVPYPDGNEVVKGSGLSLLVYLPEGVEAPLFSQYVYFPFPGLIIMYK